jgi:hypothetical protein
VWAGCGKAFRRKGYLQKHIQLVHKTTPEEAFPKPLMISPQSLTTSTSIFDLDAFKSTSFDPKNLTLDAGAKRPPIDLHPQGPAARKWVCKVPNCLRFFGTKLAMSKHLLRHLRQTRLLRTPLKGISMDLEAAPVPSPTE